MRLKGFSRQIELAQFLGVHPDFVSRWLHGGGISADNIQFLADKFAWDLTRLRSDYSPLDDLSVAESTAAYTSLDTTRQKQIEAHIRRRIAADLQAQFPPIPIYEIDEHGTVNPHIADDLRGLQSLVPGFALWTQTTGPTRVLRRRAIERGYSFVDHYLVRTPVANFQFYHKCQLIARLDNREALCELLAEVSTPGAPPEWRFAPLDPSAKKASIFPFEPNGVTGIVVAWLSAVPIRCTLLKKSDP